MDESPKYNVEQNNQGYIQRDTIYLKSEDMPTYIVCTQGHAKIETPAL